MYDSDLLVSVKTVHMSVFYPLIFIECDTNNGKGTKFMLCNGHFNKSESSFDPSCR